MDTMVSNSQTYLKILADLIKIKSVNDHELEVAEYLQDLFQEMALRQKFSLLRVSGLI